MKWDFFNTTTRCFLLFLAAFAGVCALKPTRVNVEVMGGPRPIELKVYRQADTGEWELIMQKSGHSGVGFVGEEGKHYKFVVSY
jgi:hypothetical protein